MTGKVKCHPERKRYAKGLCKSCYNNKHHDRNKARRIKRDSIKRKRKEDPARFKKIKNRAILKKYGLTEERYNKILQDQNFVCAICKKENSRKGHRLSVDHDHVTGKVRELLCHNCNLLLGIVQDSIRYLQALIEYLAKHRETSIQTPFE